MSNGMKEFFQSIFNKEWQLPLSEKLNRLIKSFSLTEKIIFFLFVGLLIWSSLSLLFRVNKNFLVEVPDYGGSLTEGIVGSPRFVNPLLASSDIDKDLTSIIYSGLLKTNAYGQLTDDLAESYHISNDGLTYTFVLKDNIYFQDGVKLTADDVVFTVEKAQDESLKSPRLSNWTGVKAEKVDDRTVTFTLHQPYSPFIQNATLGILPKHIWKSATVEEFPFSQFNVKPIGTGPYKISSISYTSSGLPKEYRLESFNKYVLGKPYISSLVIKTYPAEKDLIDAYKNGDIESLNSISPKQLPNLKVAKDEVLLSPLPRIFGVFFNQSSAPVLVNKEVRQALDTATDKDEVVREVVGGYGQKIDSPVPLKSINEESDPTTPDQRIEMAKKILTDKGWKQDSIGIFQKKDKKTTTTLAFSITTGDSPDLKTTAYLLQKQWQKLGPRVDVKIFEVSDLNQNIIKTRKYDALLFGEIVGKDLDLYQFLHSSERVSPGLKIALYTNVKAEKMQENIRKTLN